MKAKQETRKSNFCYLYWTPQKLAIRQVTLLFPGKKNEKVLNLHISLYLLKTVHIIPPSMKIYSLQWASEGTERGKRRECHLIERGNREYE
jgi:hypothetical protein